MSTRTQERASVVEVDVAVIGTGAAGSSVAYGCKEAGRRVLIIDELPFGGTCQLRGCDPKKVLVAGEELVDWSQRFAERHVVSTAQQLDWDGLVAFERSFTDPVPEQRLREYEEAGIAVRCGHARFVDGSALEIGEEIVRAEHFVLANGARPRTLGIPGEDLLTTSDQFLTLSTLPQRIVMVGGGYISFEFAHVAARAGSHVTILHGGHRPLERFDADLVADLVDATREYGIDVRTGARVRAVERGRSGLLVRASTAGAEEVAIETDLVVHGAGRVPNLDHLDLERASIAAGTNGVKVDAYLRSTSNRKVFAAGDAADIRAPRLTPVASLTGEIVAHNIVYGDGRSFEPRGIPSIVFTTPSLASVGLTEEQAGDRGLHFGVRRGDMSGWYSSRRLAARRAAFKTLIEDGSGRILGASVLGPDAEEVVNIFAVAIQHDIAASDLARTIFAYPTASSDVSYMLS